MAADGDIPRAGPGDDSLRVTASVVIPAHELDRRYDLDEVANGISLDTILSEIETTYIEKALELGAGNKQKAAELLGISYRSLRHRFNKLGFQDED